MSGLPQATVQSFLRVALAVAATVSVCVPANLAWGQLGEAESSLAGTQRVVAATVNGDVAYVDEVELELAPMLVIRKSNVPDDMMPMVRATGLDFVVGRLLIIQELKELGETVGDAELNTLFAKHVESIKRQGKSLNDIASRLNTTPEAYRAKFNWQHTWTRYASKYVDEESLEKTFAEHRSDLDGRRVRVSHILLRPREGDEEDIASLVSRMRQIKNQIDAGAITFAAAAERYSEAPSREEGGDLGFIGRKNEMVEAFSETAFSLQKGQVSPPVVTQFGVHLIKCTQIEAGKAEWKEQRELLHELALKKLYDELVAKLRKDAKIEYAGTTAHFDLERKSVVEPRAN